jgi:hypothetical protein
MQESLLSEDIVYLQHKVKMSRLYILTDCLGSSSCSVNPELKIVWHYRLYKLLCHHAQRVHIYIVFLKKGVAYLKKFLKNNKYFQHTRKSDMSYAVLTPPKTTFAG